MNKELIDLSSFLKKGGLYKEAGQIDLILKKSRRMLKQYTYSHPCPKVSDLNKYFKFKFHDNEFIRDLGRQFTIRETEEFGKHLLDFNTFESLEEINEYLQSIRDDEELLEDHINKHVNKSVNESVNEFVDEKCMEEIKKDIKTNIFVEVDSEFHDYDEKNNKIILK